jgi:nucleoside-diphosphate-sugar epimerase
MYYIDVQTTKTAIVFGAGGFIGNAMVSQLKSEHYKVIGVDLKLPDFSESKAYSFLLGDLRDPIFVAKVFRGAFDLFPKLDEVYQFAADMGGAEYVFSGLNDADIMHNSALINLNLLNELTKLNTKNNQSTPKIFYSSSACMYPKENQEDPKNPNCAESSAYPANPDSEYGWEKLFSERLYLNFARNKALNVAIARYHNIYGPNGTWVGGREKAPAAICRKIAQLPSDGGEIEVYGDGSQTRSFMFIDDCIEATRRLMNSNFIGPVNIGSEEMISINDLVSLVSKIANKKISINYKIDAPTGVRGRNSDNKLFKRNLNWEPVVGLEEGLSTTYLWIQQQLNQ